MPLIINYDEKARSFSAEGRGRSGSKIYLDGSVSNNAIIWSRCKFNFGCEPTVDHIVPYEIIRDYCISFVNRYMSGSISHAGYVAHMTGLLAALGNTNCVPNSLYDNVKSLYNSGSIELSFVPAVIDSLKNMIYICSRFETNMMYGFPKINGLVEGRLDFPLSDFACIYIPEGTRVSDSLKGAVYEVESQRQLIYLTGKSNAKLTTLLGLSFKTGDLSVLLTGLPGTAPGTWNLHIMSSQNFAVEQELRNKKGNMILPGPVSCFAHQMSNHWLLFDRTDMDKYAVYTALP